MRRLMQLWRFIAPAGSNCQSFDTYLPVYEDEPFSESFNNAVDYLDAKIREGQGPGPLAFCDLTAYIIEPGPILS
jgi:hypothetical protein